MLCGVQVLSAQQRAELEGIRSALGRAVGKLSTCKYVKMKAKEVGRLRHGCKGSTITGKCFEIPKTQEDSTAHAIKKKATKEQ